LHNPAYDPVEEALTNGDEVDFQRLHGVSHHVFLVLRKVLLSRFNLGIAIREFHVDIQIGHNNYSIDDVAVNPCSKDKLQVWILLQRFVQQYEGRTTKENDHHGKNDHDHPNFLLHSYIM
jgi:hypothetical protein